VGGFEELQATVFDERDAPAGEFDLKLVAVVAGAKQHRLPLQVDARFAVLQDALDHIISLRQLIGRDDKGRPLAGRLVGEEVLPGSPRSPARSPRCRSSRIGSRKE
jgi:hypothetical protein